MEVIELSKTGVVNKGKYIAYVDDQDYDLVNKYSWRVVMKSRTIYAYAYQRISKKKYRNIGMHRLIMGFPDGKDVDHKNGFGLDNQKSNLRACTRSQNHMNRIHLLQIKSSSKYRGVSWHISSKKWRARIKINGKEKHIGVFATEEKASEAYKKKAKVLFGEFYNG